MYLSSMPDGELIQKLSHNNSGVQSDANHLSMTALEFRKLFATSIDVSDRLHGALTKVCDNYLELYIPWIDKRLEEIALEMVQPMRRVHRWDRHEDIIRLRADLNSPIWVRSGPWYTFWKKIAIPGPRKRRTLKAKMLAELRSKARVNTLDLARTIVTGFKRRAITGWDDSDIDAYRSRYEGVSFLFHSGPMLPDDVSMKNHSFYTKVALVINHTRDIGMEGLCCAEERKLVDDAKEALSAAMAVSDGAVLHFPVTFINSLISFNTLVNQKLIDAIRKLCALSVENFNTPLDIPMDVRVQLKLSPEAT